MSCKADMPVVVRVADGVFSIPGVVLPVALEDAEDLTVSAFIGRPAMGLAELEDRSGVQHAAKVLRRLLRKYPTLASVLRLPGRRGCGGYGLLVRNDGPPLVQKRSTNVSETPKRSTR